LLRQAAVIECHRGGSFFIPLAAQHPVPSRGFFRARCHRYDLLARINDLRWSFERPPMTGGGLDLL